jgi:hypothetical protein
VVSFMLRHRYYSVYLIVMGGLSQRNAFVQLLDSACSLCKGLEKAFSQTNVVKGCPHNLIGRETSVVHNDIVTV